MTGPGAGARDFVDPAYRDRSLADVLPGIAAALGAGAAFDGPAPLALPDAPSYVLLLVDGLGDRLLRAHRELAPYLASLLDGPDALAPATAGVPSTTATSLTTLGTAMTPGGHGVVGFTSRIPGTDKLLNALMWSKDVDPHAWQPHPTAFARLAGAGVQVTTVSKREFAGSGLTEVSQRGAAFVGADRMGERLVAVQAASRSDRSLTYVYEGDLDWTGHRYGVDSPQWREQLTAVDASVRRLRELLPDAVRLLVIADHGMVDVGPADRVDVDTAAGLLDGVGIVGGEARFRHLYCRDGAAPEVVARWSEVLAGRAEVLAQEAALARGWFGPVRDEVLPRIGDVVVACTGTTAVLSSAAFPYEARLVGMHGSLTPDEMMVPLLLS